MRGTAAKAELAGGKIDMLPTPMLELGVRGRAHTTRPARGSGRWQPAPSPASRSRALPAPPVWYELHTRDFATSLPFYKRSSRGRIEPLGDTD